MDLDIEFEIENEAESKFSWQQEMYDFDISDITVEIKDFKVRGQPSVRPVRLKVVDTVDKSNCSSSSQTENFPAYSEVHTESFSVTFGGKVSWGSSITGKLEIPGGLSVGSERKQGVDLTASTTHTTSEQKTITQPGSPVVIPACKRVRATREIWATEISGRVDVRVRVHGRVSYDVEIDNWPDPTYEMDLDFTRTIRGEFTGVAGHEIRGTYQESPAHNCTPACHNQNASVGFIQSGKPYIASASHVVTGPGFRSKVVLEGVPNAVLGEKFSFEENAESPLIIDIGITPNVEGFNEIVGRSRVTMPLVGIAGSHKTAVPVTCRIPGELLGVEEEIATVMVFQPLKISILEG